MGQPSTAPRPLFPITLWGATIGCISAIINNVTEASSSIRILKPYGSVTKTKDRLSPIRDCFRNMTQSKGQNDRLGAKVSRAMHSPPQCMGSIPSGLAWNFPCRHRRYGSTSCCHCLERRLFPMDSSSISPRAARHACGGRPAAPAADTSKVTSRTPAASTCPTPAPDANPSCASAAAKTCPDSAIDALAPSRRAIVCSSRPVILNRTVWVPPSISRRCSYLC